MNTAWECEVSEESRERHVGSVYLKISLKIRSNRYGKIELDLG